jgi:RNA polymerase sigma factor (sigma-70 family)
MSHLEERESFSREKAESLPEALESNLEIALTTARPRLLQQVRRRGIALDIAEDIVQETLLEAWRSLEHLRTPEYFDDWLRGICRNVCLRWMKDAGKPLSRASISLTDLQADQGERSIDLPNLEADDLFDVLDHQDLVTLIDRAMRYLPASMREGIELCYLQELPVVDVALQLKLTPNTLRVRLHRARRQLWRLLNNELREDAQALGLALDPESALGWCESRIWCMHCGKERMRGWLEQCFGDRIDLHLRCEYCRREQIKTGAMVELRGARTFRPALNRSMGIVARYWSSGLYEPRCYHCHAPLLVRLLAPGETLASYPSDSTIRLYSQCTACSFWGLTPIGAILWSHPITQSFMTRHPRYIYGSDQVTTYQGQAAFRLEFADVASAARLIGWLNPQSFQVLHMVTE